MSMHKKPLTPLEEEEGLRLHGLDIGKPSQLSDVFRHGVAWAISQDPEKTVCEVLRARLAKYEDAEGNPIAQPAVVVLPDPKKEIVAWGHDMGGNYDEGHADGWNDALDEVARLNSSPARAGDDDDQAYDAEAERLTAEALGTGAGINPNATSIDDIFLSESAGGVGERAVPISSSLADYYRAAIAQSYPPIQAVIHELETVREWVISRKGQQEFLKNTGQKHTLIEKCEVVSELDHAINKARAALSAPSHGELVRHMVPVGWNVERAAQCDHQWTDDGLHLLVCTSCGAQEDHDPHWRDMATAPRDGTMVRLLVEFTEHETEDADQAPTIGANNFDNDGEDRWQFAGWCWSHDHFVEGKGEPVGWLPMIEARAALSAHKTGEEE